MAYNIYLGNRQISDVYLGEKRLNGTYLDGDKLFTSIYYINLCCTDLGGTGGWTNELDGINELSTLLGGTGNNTSNIDGLNELCSLLGYTDGWTLEIDALNTICVEGGGTGGHSYEDLAWTEIQTGSKLNPLPAYNLVSMWLDGSITQVGSDYYFVDKKAGNNVLITGYDFPAGWVKGFPYKSAATIDVFGQTGVPVVSLFQNFDYANQYFTRHVAQVVDGNGVETSEAYVCDIVAYSEALTGDNLTTVNTYFGVPTENVTTVNWSDPVGGSNSNAGTKVSKWQTLTKDELSSTAENQIYVQSGINNETNYWYPKKHFNWKGVGINIVRSTGTTYVLLSELPVGHVIDGFIFDSETNTTSAIYSYLDSLFRKCKLLNLKTGNEGIRIQLGNPTFDQCILAWTNTSNSLIYANNGFTITNSFVRGIIDCRITGNDVFTNNRFYVDISTNNNIIKKALGNVTIKGGNVRVVNAYSFYQTTFAYSATSALSVTDVVFDVITSCTHIFYLDFGNFGSVEFKRNKINNATSGNNILNNGGAGWDVQDNVIINTSTGSGLTLSKANATESTVIVTRNTIQTHGNASYGILVGNDAATAYVGKFTTITISKNKVLGTSYFSATKTCHTHGIMIGDMLTGNITWNYINGCHFVAALKGNGSNYTTAAISYLLGVNCVNYGIVMAGAKNAKIIGNTLINNTYNSNVAKSEIYFYAVTAGNGSTGVTVKNNIIINNQNCFLYFFDADSLTGHDIDYNIYYSNKSTPFSVNGVAKTWSEWQALGYDAHSVMLPTLAAAKALFTNYDAGDYSLIAGSAAIGAGVALDAAYDDGLDASTDWGSDSELPVVVTKQQGAAWDCGAYVH